MTFKTLTTKESTMNAPELNRQMLRRIVIASVVIASVLVGIVAGWQFGLAVLLLAAVVFGSGYVAGVEGEATTRWSSALYGDGPDDANHWSRTGGQLKR
jgi:hypothetical protein